MSFRCLTKPDNSGENGENKATVEFLPIRPRRLRGRLVVSVHAAEELLEIVLRRYERASTMLTSNRPVERPPLHRLIANGADCEAPSFLDCCALG